ncbi:alpha/beta fold hydrolase [Sinomonas sp. JGH33]|uniref:Alpha/beta fold hydrolase n=1 Tax=Sinomonas terricola TaxID=3110330 RepID=A0ABU5T6U2_9MICC|nr:alpha/beta fold hydrolase [Sinomonas sp. JGH33]MEA5455186.1 alpha/beta fold hydrolase [Sinomonas sp. JGH33]
MSEVHAVVRDLEGAGILLVHEFGGSAANVEPVAQALRARGAAVEAPNLPGHGTRWQDLADVGWRDWHATSSDAVDRLAASSPRVVVVGTSVGAAIALRLAALRPDVGAVVAVNATLGSSNPLLPLAPVLRFAVRSVATGGNDDGGLPRAYPRLPTKAVAQLPPLWRDVRRRLGSMGQPLTIVRSASDGSAGEETAEFIRSRVASEDVREVVLEQAGHVATVGPDVPAVVEAIAARCLEIN